MGQEHDAQGWEREDGRGKTDDGGLKTEDGGRWEGSGRGKTGCRKLQAPRSTPHPISTLHSTISSPQPLSALPSPRPSAPVARGLGNRPPSSIFHLPSSLSHLPSPILTRRVPVPFLLSAFPISAFPLRFQLFSICSGNFYVLL